jgi:hypothetical protein
MNFTTKEDTDSAATALLAELEENGFSPALPIPSGSTHHLTKVTGEVSQIVLMNVTEKKIDVFHGAFISTGEKVRHDKWRIKSGKKKQEVSWKIRSDEPQPGDKVLQPGWQ